MRINNPKSPYMTGRDTKLSDLLKIFKKNTGLPIVVSNNDGSLFGIISKGDLILKLSKLDNIDTLKLNAEDIANKFPIVGHTNDSYETIQGYLEPPHIKSLPILNHRRIVKKIITKESSSITFKDKQITDSSSPYLIAEIGVNHNGDLNEAESLIISAAKSGCDAIKLQHRTKNTYSKINLNSYDLGTQYILSEIEKTRLNIKEIKSCNELANSLGIDTIITPFDELALEEIINAKVNLSAIKIASCDLNNFPLIKKCSGTNLPLILSTGMSHEREIIKTSRFLLDLMVEHAFLHCNSTYPAPIEDTNLNYIPRLRSITNVIVGFSSHEGNPHIPLSSICFGAKIIEFHITKSKESSGTDHRASIETNSLKQLVDQSKYIFLSCGKNSPRKPSQGELANKLSLGKSYALNKNKRKGDIIEDKDLILLSPGSGFNSHQKEDLIGKKLSKDCSKNTIICISDIVHKSNISREKIQKILTNLKDYGYISGVPVRYHDLNLFHNIFHPKMFEFHMSDRDLTLNPANYINNDLSKVELIVHAVEQYEDGFIFDLANNDSCIVERSFNEIERLIRHVETLRLFFKQKESIPIVLNLGGFTNNDFLDSENYKLCLERVIKNLNKINKTFSGYNFMPQTMPPFPWHQGGRSFHNLLTRINKIKDFLDAIDNKICLDISHTALSCFYYNENIIEHIDTIGKKIGHIHLSDAQGNSEEGLEVGNGTLDFKMIHKAISKYKKDVYLIPEIWQGHLHEGEPFFRSLYRYLELIK